MRHVATSVILLVAVLSTAPGQSYIGRLDTIGGTTYDWWAHANVRRSVVNSPHYGFHAIWMYSSDMSNTTFPDRNMRYDFYDDSARQWTWPDPDYMQSGVNVFAQRTGYGVIDADSTGRAIVVVHTSSWLLLARDALPGAGVFDYCAGPAGQWPDMSIGDDGTYHFALSSGGGLLYGRLRTWGEWDTARLLGSHAFATYAIAASRMTTMVGVTWVEDTHAYYVLSENRGDTWSSQTELDPPPAFGGDSAARFSAFGLFPFFDSQGQLHIAAAVYPEVHDTAYINPAEIWHWCPANQPRWARVHHAGCAPEHLQASPGYSATYADRPTMGEGQSGDLYVAWEQFDSSNVEPQTDRLRAGVWISGSTDDGMTWAPGLRVTERNTSSHRFPGIIDRMAGSPTDDTIYVLYLIDQVAGFFVQGEGPGTPNPAVCQAIPGKLLAVKEAMTDERGAKEPSPTVLTCPPAGAVWFDAAGRRVLDPKSGVYFVRERSFGVLRKVIIQR